MANSNSLGNFKSKITYENKTTYGAAMIILGFLVWGLTHEYTGLFAVLLVMVPSILLVIPNESIRNSKILGILLAIVVLFVILTSIMNILSADYGYYYYYDYSPGLITFYNIILLIYCILNLISCYMLSVETKKVESGRANDITKTIDKSKINFCKYCGAELDQDTKFCPSCGKEI